MITRVTRATHLLESLEPRIDCPIPSSTRPARARVTHSARVPIMTQSMRPLELLEPKWWCPVTRAPSTRAAGRIDDNTDITLQSCAQIISVQFECLDGVLQWPQFSGSKISNASNGCDPLSWSEVGAANLSIPRELDSFSGMSHLWTPAPSLPTSLLFDLQRAPRSSKGTGIWKTGVPASGLEGCGLKLVECRNKQIWGRTLTHLGWRKTRQKARMST
ncbi:hypothetical protein DFH06DRAFT_1195767 [Mycena polygramma]|nr:hypothetical protein DFH06DRAFT_1195767 [Mycena polygramma]